MFFKKCHFKNPLVVALCSFVIAIIVLIGIQALRFVYYAGRTPYENNPFERNNPKAKFRILFLGDSTALGTGAQSNTESVAGWWGQDFPNAQITNFGQNGKRLNGLVRDFNPSSNDQFTMIIIQIGANDILHLTSLEDIEHNLSIVLDRAKTIGKVVVVLHSGNVGSAPLFSWPFKWIYSARSKAVRALYMKMTKEKRAIYIDLLKDRTDDIFLNDIPRYYSPDYLHPSGQGYKVWYESMRKTLRQEHIEFPQI